MPRPIQNADFDQHGGDLCFEVADHRGFVKQQLLQYKAGLEGMRSGFEAELAANPNMPDSERTVKEAGKRDFELLIGFLG